MTDESSLTIHEDQSRRRPFTVWGTDEDGKEYLQAGGFHTREDAELYVAAPELRDALEECIKTIDQVHALSDPNTDRGHWLLIKLDLSSADEGRDILKAIEVER